MAARDVQIGVADEDGFGICRNANCVTPRQLVPLHEAGYCIACCPRYGSLACDDCEWDDEADD